MASLKSMAIQAPMLAKMPLHNTKRLNFTLLLIALLGMTLSSQARADDPLVSILESSDYRDTLRSKGSRLPLPDWVPQDSNYKRLFDGLGKKAPIFEALGQESPIGFKIKSSRLTKLDSFVAATRIYVPVDQNSVELKVSLMVPHPALIPDVRKNLFFEFIELEPLAARLRTKSPINIQGDEATLYEITDDRGLVIFKLPNEARLIGRVAEYKDIKALLRLLEGLNLAEMKRRLTS